MKYLPIAALLIFATTPAHAEYVNGYYRQDGTYVQPHNQTAPNKTVYDNYSTRGKVNPFTGQPGTVNPQREYQPTPRFNMNTPYGGRR